MKTKTKLNNKPRFWTGIDLFSAQFLGALIYVMTLINWRWINEKVLLIVLGSIAFLLINGLATILVWNGSKKDPSDLIQKAKPKRKKR